MKGKLFVLAIGIAGLLVVFALLAFAYAPHSIAATAPASIISQPMPVDSNTPADELTLTNTSSGADTSVRHIGRSCESSSALNDTGY